MHLDTPHTRRYLHQFASLFSLFDPEHTFDPVSGSYPYRSVVHSRSETLCPPEEFFRIRLRTEKNHMGNDANPLPISPGMTAQVDILTGKKTVWQYIMKPILRATQNALTER